MQSDTDDKDAERARSHTRDSSAAAAAASAASGGRRTRWDEQGGVDGRLHAVAPGRADVGEGGGGERGPSEGGGGSGAAEAARESAALAPAGDDLGSFRSLKVNVGWRESELEDGEQVRGGEGGRDGGGGSARSASRMRRWDQGPSDSPSPSARYSNSYRMKIVREIEGKNSLLSLPPPLPVTVT